MIDNLLQPLVCEQFLTDVRYREGHLRVVNTLPERRVMGLHSPDIKQVAKQLARESGEVVLPDGTHRICAIFLVEIYLRLTPHKSSYSLSVTLSKSSISNRISGCSWR